MKYKLRIRQINETDLGVECPFIPERDEYEMYVNALKEDIDALSVVISASFISDYLEVVISSDNDFQELHSSVKDLLQNQYNDKLKTVDGFMPIN